MNTYSLVFTESWNTESKYSIQSQPNTDTQPTTYLTTHVPTSPLLAPAQRRDLRADAGSVTDRRRALFALASGLEWRVARPVTCSGSVVVGAVVDIVNIARVERAWLPGDRCADGRGDYHLCMYS